MKSEKPTKQRSKLASLMKSRGVTQRELTDQINEVFKDTETSRDTISRYCSGNRPNVHLTTILKICVVLDVTPNDIIEYE
jgi:DNA-binding Xre family transcriptional regulator